MVPLKPRILLISPMVPAQTGNGLAMRCGMFLDALHQVGNVDLLVVPVSGFRDANAISHARKLCSRLMLVETAGRRDTQLEMIVRTSNDEERLKMFARYGLPSICGHLSSTVVREACDLVTGTSYDMTVVVRNHSGPLVASLMRKTRTGRLLVDLGDDDGALHRQLAAAQRAAGNEAEARWNELEADAFDRLTKDNAKIAYLTSVSNPLQVLPLSRRTGITPPVVIPNSIAMKEPRDPVTEPTMIMVGTLNYKPKCRCGIVVFQRYFSDHHK